MTPYYSDDLVTIYHADARDVPVAGSAVVTDPPYGFGAYESDVAFDGVLTFLLGRSFGATAVFGYPELLAKWCVEAGALPSEWVVWWPTNRNVGRGPRLPKETEHIAFFGALADARSIMRPRSANASGRKIALSRGDDPDWARDGDVWRDPTPGGHFNSGQRLHPNEKPVDLLRKVLRLIPHEPGITPALLDPFMGSGTTLVAAKSLGRHAIGIEIEERYCEIAAKRCSQEVLGLAV